MFKKAQRKPEQILTDEYASKILTEGGVGVLGLYREDGYPYAVPLNYVIIDGKAYFHCAKKGDKLDAIKYCDRACLTVIEKDTLVPEEATTYFRSVMAFGKVRIVEDYDEVVAILQKLGEKYLSQFPDVITSEIAKSGKGTGIIELDIEFISGKQAEELA